MSLTRRDAVKGEFENECSIFLFPSSTVFLFHIIPHTEHKKLCLFSYRYTRKTILNFVKTGLKWDKALF